MDGLSLRDIGRRVPLPRHRSSILHLWGFDADGKPVDAAVPIEVAIEDPDGRPAEGSGSWATTWGEIEIPIQLAPNDVEGVWRVRVRELASGLTGAATFRLGDVPPDSSETAPPGKDAGNAVQPDG